MNPQEREFFLGLRQAAFLNPFGEQRKNVDLELTGLPPGTPNATIITTLTSRAEATIAAVRNRQQKHRAELSAEDQSLYRSGILFFLFHTYCDAFDRLIEDQIGWGLSLCPVPFAGQALERFTDFGFGPPDALHYFALFFQMRRAFYFINGITGRSACVRALRNRLWENIFTQDITLYDRHLWDRMGDFSTLLLGETGTGKGLTAAAIGRSGFIPFNEKTGTFSESFTQAFLSINLSQYPEQRIESELFGHKKGAFTGAIEAHDGVFSRCNRHRAIFLDEIGEVDIPIQIKLLQVLQDRSFTPVGSHAQERFHGRVIAATNKNMDTLRTRGGFRDDFYYRLCSDIIEVPPLRRRLAEDPGEIEEILGFIIKRILGQCVAEIRHRVQDFLLHNQPTDYPWPGNVRELEQCVRGILLRNGCEWQRTGKAETPTNNLVRGIENGTLTAQQLLSAYSKSLYDRLGTYEAVARVSGLDRRTVKKYIETRVE